MGSGPSKTRKITIDNENPTSVIKVSDDVVDRLRGQQRAVSTPQSSSDDVFPVISSSEPTLTSIQHRQAKLEDLKKNDEYWSNRLKLLKQNHEKINKILEDEYKKTVEEETAKDKKSDDNSVKNLIPPCQGCKEAVIKCYSSNPKEPMKCSNLVQAFQDCVDSKRNHLIASRG